ncbi:MULTISPECIES: hypothetical protein [unclassified Paenibacillus]|uniref:hypothetical protein n=1 Tax=unclassified Paenibacillus TaxID=185978 RepID=UPI001AE410ED|nr:MULTISPECIES: hypothetical protein [unclassified Paenibacillus]MBP1155522.1 hypothetical protein [Paenibacillus sp. PvP091]MBP1169092.1 hypothetical protein [Paenibacillus sp. PvR098]MBP2440120.1 hypothetical protein [Paenibacillus sp. PvP052]
MIAYGGTDIKELRFEQMKARIEPRDDQWIDVDICFQLADGALMPEGIEELSALLICTRGGDIIDIVPQDEGRDCEFRFTESEKQQLQSYFEREVMPRIGLRN